jgi:hypothetical protein
MILTRTDRGISLVKKIFYSIKISNKKIKIKIKNWNLFFLRKIPSTQKNVIGESIHQSKHRRYFTHSHKAHVHSSIVLKNHG